MIASLFLPWYGLPLPFTSRLVTTGFGAFSFAEAALVLTAGGALALIGALARGRRPALPLADGTLLAAAGVWAALLVAYRLIDRPEIELGGAATAYDPRYGIFLALAGAVTLAVAGLRRRRAQRGAPPSEAPPPG